MLGLAAGGSGRPAPGGRGLLARSSPPQPTTATSRARAPRMIPEFEESWRTSWMVPRPERRLERAGHPTGKPDHDTTGGPPWPTRTKSTRSARPGNERLRNDPRDGGVAEDKRFPSRSEGPVRRRDGLARSEIDGCISYGVVERRFDQRFLPSSSVRRRSGSSRPGIAGYTSSRSKDSRRSRTRTWTSGSPFRRHPDDDPRRALNVLLTTTSTTADSSRSCAGCREGSRLESTDPIARRCRPSWSR
jgi:hypothetical protein